jgi:CRP-like cAMP-binding protein
MFQCTVLYLTNQAFVLLFRRNGCEGANDMPSFVRKLDAQLEMKHLMPHMKMFHDCGSEFLSMVLNHCECRFIDAGELLFSAGDAGEAVVFIAKGTVRVHLADGEQTLHKSETLTGSACACRG